MRLRRAGLAAALVLGTTSGCALVQEEKYLSAPLPATVGVMTPQNRALRAVPLPHRRVTVSIYDLPDLTGQYKDTGTGQTLSRAVSQGGAAILVKALQDAGERRWFQVLDRSSLDNLLRERQIVTEMRRIYRGEDQIDPDALGPLAHSGLLIEGAVIGYDTNTLTGGYGARYLGIGANKKWKLDTVTVNLRLLSSETGEVLASVVARKPIASVSEQGSIFAYVALDEIVEGELGRTVNEPKLIALEQAVEKAVMALIAEGAMAGAWSFANKAEGDAFVADYLSAKFDGSVTQRATHPVRSTSPGALAIPPTVPRRAAPPRIEIREVPPATSGQNTPPLPPNGASGSEVLG